MPIQEILFLSFCSPKYIIADVKKIKRATNLGKVPQKVSKVDHSSNAQSQTVKVKSKKKVKSIPVKVGGAR